MSEEKCPICDGWGVVQKNVPYNHPDFGKSFPCPKCRTYADKRLERIRRMSRLSHYQDQNFENFKLGFQHYSELENDILQIAYEEALQFASNPLGWFVLVGGTGTGKTHLAAAIAHQMVEQGRRTIFITVPDLLDDLRSTFAPTSDVTYSQEFDTISNVDVLILDDLGVESSSPWAQEKLYQIINHRYNRQLITVITTNVNFSEMDDRVASRLRDRTISIVTQLNLPDYRVGDRVENTELEELTLLKNFSDLTFENLNLQVSEGDTLQEAIESLRQMIFNKRGIVVVVGGTGSGKTHLAVAAGHEWQQRYSNRPIFVNTFNLMDYLRASFDSHSRSNLDDRLQTIYNAPLLILDDYRITPKTSEWVQDKLAQVVDFRYTRALPTILTFSNEFAAQIRDLQPLIFSRLADRRLVSWRLLATKDYRLLYTSKST